MGERDRQNQEGLLIEKEEKHIRTGNRNMNRERSYLEKRKKCVVVDGKIDRQMKKGTNK